MKNWLRVIFCSLVAVCIIYSNNNVKAYTAAITKKVYNTEEIINSTEKMINGGTLYYSEPATTYDFIDELGQYNAVYMNDEHIYWSRFNRDMEIENTVVIDMYYDKSNSSDFDKDLVSNFGNAIYYKEHLYIVYGRENISTNAPEGANYNTMAVVKYDKQGNIIAELEMKSSHLNNFTSWRDGTYLPFFPNSNCSLAVNNKGILACFYGKTQFESHQMSNIFFLDISGEGIEWVSNRFTASEENQTRYNDVTSYCNSHSMFTRIISTRDGDFVIADSGDASKRGLTIGKIFENEELKKLQLISYRAIHYREGASNTWGYNYTFSVPGNVVEVSDGYLYIGAMEKTLSMSYGKSINEPWNLLVQKYKTNFQNETERKNVTVFDTPVRVPTGEKPESGAGRLYLQGTEVDYGIKWLTDLNNKMIIQVRPAKIDDNHVAILWEELPYTYDEKYGNSRDTDEGNIYYMIIDNNGEIVFEKTQIPDVRLPMTEDLVYKDGKICWTTATGYNREITVNILDIEHPIPSYIGDITRDGKVNGDDATEVMDKYKANKWNAEDLDRADMNRDGRLNADDATAIIDIFKNK